MESEKIKMTTQNPFIREQKIMQTLSNAKDVGMKIAKDALKEIMLTFMLKIIF